MQYLNEYHLCGKLLFMKKIWYALILPFISITILNAQPLIPRPPAVPKIQAAILLDVSNSMDGLIDQAKAQLWNMVNVMGKAECSDRTHPTIEIALYEYGRSNGDIAHGFVKKISGFTTDLDELSKKLFALTTNGGDEYCGQVMYTALEELQWDPSPNSYKTIFIAGNEDFLQGKLKYTAACAAAKKKGVIINTIYCGDKMQGIQEHWNLGAECGTGSFSNIDQQLKIEEIPTPYDSILLSLNKSLNSTYVYYGTTGASKYSDQASVDEMNYQKNKSAAVKRVEVKSKKALYTNEQWDLVDAETAAPGTVKKVDVKTLPKNLQNKSKEEIELYVKNQKTRREEVQKKIETVSKQRNDFIKKEKLKSKSKEPTLETAIETAIKTQAKKFRMNID